MTRQDAADGMAIAMAGAGDAGAVADLLVALEEHYLGEGRSQGRDAALAMVLQVMAMAEGTRFLLARHRDRPAALACCVHVRPGARLEGVLWIKDLFVAAPFRGRGLGERMMVALAAHARAQGLGRIDLTTEPSNEGAQAFYDRLGGAVQPKVFYRFEGEALARLADRPGGPADP